MKMSVISVLKTVLFAVVISVATISAVALSAFALILPVSAVMNLA